MSVDVRARETARAAVRIRAGVGAGLFVLALASFCFVLVLPTYPLYFSNQNTKFTHGMALAQAGHLARDWFANTKDGLPVFTAFIRAVFDLHAPILVYVVQVLASACFLVSVFGLARAAQGAREPREAFAIDRAGIVALAIILLSHVSGTTAQLWKGVAGQYALGPYLEPQNAGVLVLAGILGYALERKILALGLVALAATIHPGYIAPGAWLLVCFLLAEGRNIKKLPLSYGLALALAFAALIGHALYLKLHFAPTDPQAWARAQYLITDVRIPGHSQVAVWLFGRFAWVKIVAALLAVWIARANTIGRILGAGVAGVVLVSLVAAVTGYRLLELIEPWRASAFLVPLAMAVLTGKVAALAAPYLPKQGSARFWRSPLLIVPAAIMIAVMGYRSWQKLHAYPATIPAYARYLRDTADDNTVILAPAAAANLRLQAMAPVYITYRSHPYQDNEVLEWYRRVTELRALYAPLEVDCGALEKLTREAHATHIVVLRGRQALDCPFAQLVHHDKRARVFKLALPPPTSS